ncbi:hypothetical protein QAD02_005911 [Eretmocerus hayati]|uniref:Uncharacterized protein n=1 Tax=Eretmocerus hayati TaxID=131215 RepID=A0ACC2N1T2_9HYME|nr:hypothetical protein QAD02_005911 [Eretmocerus hayati]
MNSSYLLGSDDQWGTRYYFSYYGEFGDRRDASRVEVLAMALIFVLAVAANLGIAVCVLSFREMRTPVNLCLLNLAITDLLFALGIPAAAYTRLTQDWRLGETVCRILPYSQFVCGSVLLWTLTLISIDRYYSVAKAPYRSCFTMMRVAIATLIIWLVSAILSLPAAFWFGSRNVSGGRTICTMVFPRSDVLSISFIYTISVIVFFYALPVGMLEYFYVRIWRKMIVKRDRWAVPCVAPQGMDGQEGQVGRRRDSELSVMSTVISWAAGRKLSSASVTGTPCPGLYQQQTPQQQQQQGRQVRAGSLSQHEEHRLHKHEKVVRVLRLNVVFVPLMWLPITFMMLLIQYDGGRPTEDTQFFLRSHHFIWTLTVAQMNTVLNPVLYGVCSEQFRSCFAKLWGRRCELASATGNSQPNLHKHQKQSHHQFTGPTLNCLHGKSRSGTAGVTTLSQQQLRAPSSCRPTNSSIASIMEVPMTEKQPCDNGEDAVEGEEKSEVSPTVTTDLGIGDN